MKLGLTRRLLLRCCGNADRAVGAIGRRFWPSRTGIEYHTSGRMQDIQMVRSRYQDPVLRCLRFFWSCCGSDGPFQVIPTGTVLDSRYLCHFWRMSFAPLHDFVNRQPSKPDDIAINLLIQHLRLLVCRCRELLTLLVRIRSICLYCGARSLQWAGAAARAQGCTPK